MALREALSATVIVVAMMPACRGGDPAVHADAIRELVSGTPAWVERTGLGRRLWRIERAFYETRGHIPAWIRGTRPGRHMEALLQQLGSSERHGLDPAQYDVDEFRRAQHESKTFLGVRFDPARVPELDARLTYSGEHSSRRDAPAGRPGSGVPSTQQYRGGGYIRHRGSLDRRLVGRVGGLRPAAAPTPGARQCPRACEVHLPQPLQHLPARHAERSALRHGCPRAEPRVHPD